MVAIRQLRQVQSAQQSQDTCDKVLDAIGHNHSAGSTTPQGPAAAILVAVIRATQGWPRRTVMEILIDCLAWVRPGQRFIDLDGCTRSVKAVPPMSGHRYGRRAR
jgi:hypothetical protein